MEYITSTKSREPPNRTVNTLILKALKQALNHENKRLNKETTVDEGFMLQLCEEAVIRNTTTSY